jgi:hypothetical protein
MTAKTQTAPETTVDLDTDVAEAPVANLRETRKAAAAAKKQAAAKATRTSLKWQIVGERDERNRVEQHATAADGTTYSITGADKTWTLTVTPAGGKAEVVAEGGHGKCYGAAVKHHAEAQA